MILSLLIIIGSHQMIGAQDKYFNQRELSIIHLKAKAVLQDYESVTNQLGDAIVHDPSRTKEMREQFMELVSGPNVWLFNDLDPTYKLSKYFEAETYINNLELFYEDGISVDLNLEEVQTGEILSHGSDVYSLDFRVNKQIYGNYRNLQYNTSLVNLLFRIGFTTEGREFQNFKIVGVNEVDAEVIPNYDRGIEELNSMTLNESEHGDIATGIESLINDYSNYISLSGSAQESDFDKQHYAKSFLDLFESPDIQIYNDLIPDPLENYISAGEYMDVLRLTYPAGITRMNVTIDSILFNNVIREDNKQFSVIIGIDKMFVANYMEDEVFSNMFALTLKISFVKSGRVFKEFRIRSIEPEADDFLALDEPYQMPGQAIAPVTRKGLAVEFHGSYGYTLMEDHSLLDLSMEEDGYAWEHTPGFGFTAGAGVLYSVGDHVAFKTGFYYNRYETTYSIQGAFEDSRLSSDVNLHGFHKNMATDYDSLLTCNYISIPLTMTITSSNPGKLGIYFSIGGLFSYGLAGSYLATGSWAYTGYYPDHPEALQTLDLKELGYYNEEDIKRTGALEGGQINLSARASLGFSIPIKYFTQITLGPELEWGLYDVNMDRVEETGIFGEEITHHPTYLFRLGIRMGMVFKL